MKQLAVAMLKMEILRVYDLAAGLYHVNRQDFLYPLDGSQELK
jgi:hypothetical protein